ncbi:MAG TPA: aminotransferase class IV [Kofleriaceae bacterium]|jgi:branched-chain amino acid aminotransferase|nr:aminotransferase class IV [Kofleriaceae bacterium]
MLAISIDGELVDRERATISVLDRGLLYGDGVFEVFRAGFAVDAHLDRLYASAAVLELRVMPRDVLAPAIAMTIAAAGEGEHRVRVIVTRGPGALTARLGELGPGRAIVIVEPLPPQPRELSAVTIDRAWLGAGHKTLAYLDHVIARELATAGGADEAVRIDRDGNVSEGATSNLFAVVEGAVVTPALAGGVLPGITRSHVLAICARLAIPARELAISRESFAVADELFATSALRGVVPITRLDGVPRAAGPVTARIAAAYVELFHRR